MIAFDLFDLIIIKSSLNVAGDMHLIRKKEISASDFSYIAPNRQKVHTKVVDATVDKIYSKTINSTVEYIFQYSYTLNVIYNADLYIFQNITNFLIDLSGESSAFSPNW